MNRLTITVPHRDNQGNLLEALHARIRSKLVGLFGGYTSVPVEGAWQDPKSGTIYHDVSTRYEVIVEEKVDSLHDLAKLVKITGKQQCVLLTEEPVTIECQ